VPAPIVHSNEQSDQAPVEGDSAAPEKVAWAIAAGNRAVSEVAGEYGVSWPTAHKALVAAAAGWLPERPRPAGCIVPTSL
jgi:hypothetical protein